MNYYIEKQKFTEWWVYAIVILVSIPMIIALLYGVYQQVILGKPWGDSPMSDAGLILVTVLTIALIGFVFLLFFSSELTIEVRDRSVFVRFAPFFTNFKRFGMEEIESWDIISYNPITRYRGWGIRYSLRHGKSYNVGGRFGLQLKFTNKKKLLIGTKDPAGLKKALDREFSKENNGDF